MKVIIFKEKHYDRVFAVPDEDIGKVFLKVFKERDEEGWYSIYDELGNEHPIEPAKPESNEKWVLDAYEKELEKYNYKLKDYKNTQYDLKILKIARNNNEKAQAKAAFNFMKERNMFEYERFDIIEPEGVE